MATAIIRDIAITGTTGAISGRGWPGSADAVLATHLRERSRLRREAIDIGKMIGWRRRIQGTRVGRPWAERVADLFACGVEYRDKSVLDAGCNVGILAYEISKQQPSFLHLLDGTPELFKAAQLIFRAVETPHRLDRVDLTDERRLRVVLQEGYDIVQLLAVYQHIEHVHGEAIARRVVGSLAERCRETFIAATNPRYLPPIVGTLAGAGFELARETASSSRNVRHVVFHRR